MKMAVAESSGKERPLETYFVARCCDFDETANGIFAYCQTCHLVLETFVEHVLALSSLMLSSIAAKIN